MAPLRKAALICLKLAVSSLALAAVFRKVDAGQIVHLLKQVGPWAFLAVAGLYIISQVFSTLRWRALLFGEFGFRKLFSLYMIGSFFNSFLPGLIGGDAVKAYYLSRDARKISTVLATVFMDRYVGFVALMLIGILCFPFSIPYFRGTHYLWLMPGIFGAFVAGSLLFFTLRIGRRFRGVGNFYGYFAELKAHKKVLASALALSAIVQILNIIMVVILAMRLGEEIPVLSLCVFLPIIITITTVPVSISGLGVREGAFVVLLGLIGIEPEPATSLSLAWFFSGILGGLPGLAAYFMQSRQQKLPEAIDGQAGRD